MKIKRITNFLPLRRKSKKLLLIMRLSLILMLAVVFNVSASVYSQSVRIDLELENASLENVFQLIQEQTEFDFFYKNEFLPVDKIINKTYTNAKIDKVLDDVLEGTGLIYRVLNKDIIVTKGQTFDLGREDLFSQQQSKTITGKVIDENGDPLPGVSVVVPKTTTGTVTNADGTFQLNVPSGTESLTFSFIGFKMKEISLENELTHNVQLEQDVIGLDEVVAVGYGTMKKSDLTGAISSISAEELSSVAASNVLEQAQGRLAGVDVVSSNGTPGSGQTIRIRGNRSITANNDPLYVVDGIPTTQKINDFNPGDIESMEVLKDASAVAIYGSRGANGVILITTKRGKEGNAKISLNSYYGVKQQIENFDKMNGQQFTEYRRVANGLNKSDNSQDELLLGGMYDNYLNGVETNYLKETYRNGLQTEHQLAASGGNKKIRYYVSGGYYKEEGVLKKTDYERLSLRVNLDAELTEKINIGLSFTTSKDLRNRMDDDDPTNSAIRYAPLTDAYDEDGNIVAYPNPDEFLVTSPLVNFAPNQYVDETKGFRLFSNLFGEYAISKDLKYRLNVGTDVLYSRRGRFTGDYIGSTPEGSIDNANVFSYTLENILTYDKSIGEHDLNLVGLFSAQSNSTEESSLSSQGIPITRSTFYALGTAETITGISSGLTEWGLLSYMGRINYKYKDRYLLTASGRADGSSRLANENKWAFFPAASVAWIISEESFMNIPVLSFLKIRAGYGSVGNTAINPYQTQGGLARTAYVYGDDSAFGYRQDGIANPELSWEISSTLNIGMDFGLWKNRISGNFEIYDTKTENLLLERLLPSTSGFESVIENVGSTRNRGWELTLSGNVLNSSSGFKWDIDMNLFSNKEEIVELFNGSTDDVGNEWFIGEAINSFYNFDFDGIWQTDEAAEAELAGQAPGQVKIKDVNGRDENGFLTKQPDGQINSDDRTILGSTVPDWTGGLTNRLSFKGFDFSMLIYARQGQMLQSNYHNFGANNWEGRYAHWNFNYWTPDNPSNEYPKPVQGGSILYATALRYFDGSFVKLKNISLGYDFANSILKTDAISSCRLYLSATNPITWSKYDTVDPETRRALSSATYIVGLNLKF